ncbi:MAG: D-alanine--D-alanine ligase [Halobacteriovoraceae bacterium]|nr:D-alanine--D-alanine ligase [Halobacteriovoraceae bacterium]|tara:strand:+ start:28510 stop:29529 length:1020 start_codon:yes stop_codon:yes gene_type:complete
MAKLKVLVLMHKDLIPPDEFTQEEYISADWKTEYDIIQTLKELGHEVQPLGIIGNLELLRSALYKFKPHIVFNLLEEFDGDRTFDQHIVSYLELKKQAYTGCNPRGLTLARDKALSKKILAFHKIPVPKFFVFPKNQKVKESKKYIYPLIVKSSTEEASTGISQASVVNNFEALKERVEFIHTHVETDAIAEQYIKGRELYVGILGNKRVTTFPVWELEFSDLPKGTKKFATEKVKWDDKYREKYGIQSIRAANLSEEEIKQLTTLTKKVYKALGLSGYARLDFRLEENGKAYFLEANPNPGIQAGDEFPESAEAYGLSYKELIGKLVSLGMSWHRNRQ